MLHKFHKSHKCWVIGEVTRPKAWKRKTPVSLAVISQRFTFLSIRSSISPSFHPSNHSLRASSAVQASNLWLKAAAALWLPGSRALIIVHGLTHMHYTHACTNTHMRRAEPSHVVCQLAVACLRLYQCDPNTGCYSSWCYCCTLGTFQRKSTQESGKSSG